MKLSAGLAWPAHLESVGHPHQSLGKGQLNLEDDGVGGVEEQNGGTSLYRGHERYLSAQIEAQGGICELGGHVYLQGQCRRPRPILPHLLIFWKSEELYVSGIWSLLNGADMMQINRPDLTSTINWISRI